MIHTFSTALFPAERAPDEDDDKGAGNGDNRSTQINITCARSPVFVSSAMLKQCVIKLFFKKKERKNMFFSDTP